jgi:hypothetical protein
MWDRCPQCNFDFVSSNLYQACDDESKKSSAIGQCYTRMMNYFTEMMYNAAVFTDTKPQNEANINNNYADVMDEVEIEDDDYVFNNNEFDDYSACITGDIDFGSPHLHHQISDISTSAASKYNYSMHKSIIAGADQYPKLCLPAAEYRRTIETQTDFISWQQAAGTTTSNMLSSKVQENSSQNAEDSIPFLYRINEESRRRGFKITGPAKKLKRSNSDKSISKMDSLTSYDNGKQNGFPSKSFLSPGKREFEPEATPLIYFREIFNHETISSILKLIFNLAFGAIIFYVVYMVIGAIRDDVYKKQETEIQHELLKMEQCSKDYKINGCDPSTRLPALEVFCQEKEKCLNSDPRKAVHNSRMTAAIFAHILNDLIEPLGFKTIAVLVVTLFGLIITCNCSLSGSRPIRNQPEIKDLHKRLNELEFSSAKKDRTRLNNNRYDY